MSAPTNIKDIPLDSIVRSAQFQVRSRMDSNLVRTYAKAMENGTQFLPVQLADIKGTLFLVDGWHRYAAANSLNRETIAAEVKPMTRFEALQAAALANTRHGAPLKQKERRAAFKTFIKGKGHKKSNGDWMSYREISQALGGHVGHTTIHGWMQKDFPKIAEDMGVEAVRGKGNGNPPRVDVQGGYFREARQTIADTLNLYDLLEAPERRYEIIQQMHLAIKHMEQATHTKPEF